MWKKYNRALHCICVWAQSKTILAKGSIIDFFKAENKGIVCHSLQKWHGEKRESLFT